MKAAALQREQLEPHGSRLRPKRVLMTLDAVGGVWRYAIDLAAALGREGIEVVLVGSGPSADDRQRSECADIGAELLWIGEPLDWLAPGEDALATVAAQLFQIAAAKRIELVHLNLPSQAAGFPAGLPVVVASHSCVATWWDAVRGSELPASWRWHRQLNRSGLDRADVVVTPSRSHGAALGRIYGEIANLQVVPNATTPPNLAEAKADMVLSAGRWWDEGKNGRVLDEAAATSPWPVVLAGPLAGPNGEASAFRHAATPGEVPAQVMRSMMHRAAIFAAPSRYEPFGLAVLEAAASGAALLLSDIPTFRELWEDAASFVPPDDPAAWSREIRRLAGDVPARWSLGEKARERARRFSTRRQVIGMLGAYESAMRRATADAAAR